MTLYSFGKNVYCAHSLHKLCLIKNSAFCIQLYQWWYQCVTITKTEGYVWLHLIFNGIP